LNYEDIGQTETDDSIIKTEGAILSVNLKDLLEIIKADSVVLKFGTVTYRSDKDNLAAFHYLAEQIQKDYKYLPKRKSQAKSKKRKAV